MAQYSAHAMLASLNIKDTPLRYSPPRGPAVNFTVTYNQREAQSTTGAFSNLGPNWTFSWLAYVTDDPNTQLPSTSVYLPGGGSEIFAFDSGTQTFAPDPQSNAVLVRTSSNTYERRLPDGSKQVYGAQSNGATSYPRLLFMTKMIDPAGNFLTINYDGSNRITSVTDALGQTTTLSYQLPGDSFKVTKVTDPFGRFAVLGYANGKLASVTDPVGIQSQFGYAPGTSTINSLTTPYGTSTFASGMSGSTRWLEMTDPMGGKERVEYRDNAPEIGGTDPTNTVPSGFTNSGLDVANTFFWDKRAVLMSPPGVYDYTKARITHWAKNAAEGVTGIVASEKAPLEYRVWSKYAGQSDTNHTGPTANPIQVARVLADGTPQLFQYEYNGLGKTTKETDPAGRVMTYIYDSNQIDLLEVRQTRGTNNELLRRLTYNSLHKPLTDTDAAGQVTTNTYNTFGQILTSTNARGETTSYAYGGSVPTGYLASITSPQFNGNSAVVSYTYDEDHRVLDVIYEPDQSTTLTYYDNLDRKTFVLYPDGDFEYFVYTNDTGAQTLEVTRSLDRMGRWTIFHYNANRQMVSMTDPENRTTLYDWCTCGSLNSITDPNGNVTTFHRDLQGRVYQKVFADGRTIDYLFEGQTAPNTAGATSQVKSATDALGRRTNYSYLANDNISAVTYTNTSGNPLNPPTPSVTYTYDPNYNRIETMTDGADLTTYEYNPVPSSPARGAGMLHSIDGPLEDDTISFDYDQLGRTVNQWIQGGDESVVTYDSLGRVAATDNALGHFDRAYDGVTGRLQSLTNQTGQTTNYVYFGNDYERRLQTLENLDSGSANLSKFDYTYDPGRQITSWNRQLGPTSSERWFEYDDAQQLVVSRNHFNPSSATQVNGYGYDDAGNRTTDSNFNPQGPPGNGTGHGYTPNNLNQIETIDIQNGNISWQVMLAYDLAGNLIDDGLGKTFEWDAANRLRAINYGGNRSEFSYDGLSRRVKIVEKVGSTVTSTKHLVWVGTEIAQERGSHNEVTRQYFPEGEYRDKPFYYTRDHLGSIRELTNVDGELVAQYDYDPYGQRTKLSGTADVDFGYTGHYHHTPSGLNLTLYRAYNPAIGRWLSRDPLEEAAGINLYEYVENNPVNLVDPLGLRPLTDCEKKALKPFIPQIDLDNADLHDGKVPWWLPKRFEGVTLHNDIYFRPGVYNSATPAGLALLGHELVHVGQFRNGLTLRQYIWRSRRGYNQSPYEPPAYKKQDEIMNKLSKTKCCK